MIRPTMLRSAAYRIAILSSLAYAMATIALGGAVYYAAHRGLQRQFDDRIAAETSTLLDEYRSDGALALHRMIAMREAAGVSTDLRYALFAADGRRIVGNYLGGRPDPGIHTIAIHRPDGDVDPQRVMATGLADGERLVVAADWDALEENDRLILSLLGLACVAVALIGGAGALLLGAYLRRRLSAISIAAEAIMGGDLAQRIVIGPRGDEFDRLSTALNAMLDRIGDLLDNLQQVSSEIAHDLRTPLTRLRNHLESSRDAGGDPAATDRAIEQVDDILALFGAILRLSEIEAGKLAASFGPVDLSALAAEIGDSYAPAFDDGGRTLRCAIATLPPVRGDRELIAQAIVNLLENAQRHTPPGTIIGLSLVQSEGRVRLSVSDDGPGVPAEDRDRITRRFARLESSRSRPGHGLGLSLVAAIARAHGAALEIADNAPGLIVSMAFSR